MFEFLVEFTLAYRFDNDHKLGVTISHISNADIHDRNPGSESILLSYTEPFVDCSEPWKRLT